ncbi:MAG TPA: dockerin type I domain-containing protein, partial [Phycisphaerae bacterium]
VDWQVTPMPPLPDVALQGVGIYRIGGEVAVQQRMRLDLISDAGSPPQHFDSGTVAGGGNFPLIDISVVFQESLCIQTVIDVHAEPSVLIASANPPAQNPYLPGVHPFRDVLQTGTFPAPLGIGNCQTPPEGPVDYCPITVSFTAPTALTPADITIACSYTGNPPGATPCPTVTIVTGSGSGPYSISLSDRIPPGGCTTLTFANGPVLRYEYLPGDVNMDGIVNTQDLLALVQALNNGSANLPGNLARYDLTRGGAVNTQDLLKLVMLLNGVNTTQVWNGVALVACQ